jgi:uncharacterized membrane protein
MVPAIWLHVAALIEFAGSLIIAGYTLAAVVTLLRRAPLHEARRRVAQGAISGLDLKMAATLLKTLALSDWHAIGMFVAILALRTILKKSFVRDLASHPLR